MTLTTSMFITFIISFFLIYIIMLTKNNKINIKNSLRWYILAIILLFFVWIPGLFTFFSKIVGVYSETNFIFFIGFCISLWIIFDLSKSITSQEQKIRELTQDFALLQKDFYDKEKKDNKSL